MPIAAFMPARYAMGDTARFPERTDLVEMEPRKRSQLDGYAWATPVREYIMLQSNEPAAPFT
jgi:hypothetical protein